MDFLLWFLIFWTSGFVATYVLRLETALDASRDFLYNSRNIYEGIFGIILVHIVFYFTWPVSFINYFR